MKNKLKGILVGIAGTIAIAGVALTGTALIKNGIGSTIDKEQQQEQLSPAKKDIGSLVFNDISDQTYTGEAIIPAVIVLDGQKQLEEGKDYILTYSNNTYIGIADVLISAKGNDYQGEKTIHFNIKQANSWIVEPEVTATTKSVGQPKFGDVRVFLKEASADDTTYIEIFQTENGDWAPAEKDYEAISKFYFAGQSITCKLAVDEGAIYFGLEKTFDYVIPYFLNVNTIDNQTYTGQAITPTVVVKNLDTSETLTLGTDYTVEYLDNINVGTATAIITFINNYADIEPETKTFIIQKADTFWNVLPNILVNGSDLIIDNGSATFGCAKCYLQMPGNSDYVEVSGILSNMSIGFYAFRFEIEGTDNYSDLTFDGFFEITKPQNEWLIMPSYSVDHMTVTINAGISTYGTVEYYYIDFNNNNQEVIISGNSVKITTSGDYLFGARVVESDEYTGLEFTEVLNVTAFYFCSFYSDGELNSSRDYQEYIYDWQFPKNFTKTGYVLTGWSIDSYNMTPITFDEQGRYFLSADTEFYAIFTETYNDFTFQTVLSGGVNVIKVSRYTGSDTVVYVPSSYSIKYVDGTQYYTYGDDYQVTSIGYGAFQNNTTVVSITIPSSINDLTQYAFSGCSNLQSVTGLSNVVTCSTYVFENCSNLISVDFSSNLKNLYHSAFYGCSSLTSVGDLSGLTFLPNDVFYGCSSLETIEVRNVTSCGVRCFSGMTNLTTIIFSDVISAIASSAFDSCSALNVYIYGDSLASINNFYAFPDNSTIYVKDTLVSEYQTTYASAISNHNYTIASIPTTEE